MKKENPVPVRLEEEQCKMLVKLKQTTGLNTSYLIRRCIAYALPKFATGETDILTLKRKPRSSVG